MPNDRQTDRSGAKSDLTPQSIPNPQTPKPKFHETATGALTYLLGPFLLLAVVVQVVWPDKVTPTPAPTKVDLAQQAKDQQLAEQKIHEESRQADCNRVDDFYDRLKDKARRNLKAPSTAKFADLGDEGVRVKKLVDGADGSCSYYILSYVDAENGFGAHIRTQFIGKVVMKDYDYRVENFAFNN